MQVPTTRPLVAGPPSPPPAFNLRTKQCAKMWSVSSVFGLCLGSYSTDKPEREPHLKIPVTLNGLSGGVAGFVLLPSQVRVKPAVVSALDTGA